MPRLILTDLLANTRIWLGAFVVIVATAFVAAVSASFIETGTAQPGDLGGSLDSMAGVVIAFTSVAAIVVLSSVASLIVSLQQRGYALWQLAGIRPSFVSLVVIGQLTVVAVAGALIGCLVAVPLLPGIFRVLFSTWPEMAGVPPRFGPTAALWLIAAVVVVVLLGGSRGARRAGRVAPIEALREPEPPRMRVGWLRWTLAALVLAGMAAMSLGLGHESFTAISSQSIMLTPLLSAPLAALGPLLFPLVLRAWSALVPGRASASWFLARHSAGYRLGQSSAAIGPLMVAIALAGGLYTAIETLSEASRARGLGGGSLGWGPAVIILGGPLLLSGFGAAATVFMSGRAREREFALIQSAGATNATIAVMSVWEAVIYAVTAATLAAVTILAGGAVLASALGVPLVVAVAPSAGVAGGGLALLLAATVPPALIALRHEVPRTLAAE